MSQNEKKAFQGYKNKKIKKSKNSHFSKAVNPRFWSKNGQFSNFFLGNIGQENVFYDILERINAFLGCKNKKIKKQKNRHFSKGVSPWFWYKNGHFSNFIFQAIQARRSSFTMSQNAKKAFQGYKNKKIKKSKNSHFSKAVNPRFWSKNGQFSNFFLGNIGQENVFYDILERIKAFLGCKSKKIKKSKNRHFSKGVSPWFWYKNGHFSNFFFLGKIGLESVFYDILVRKTDSLGYKNKNIKNSKN